MHELGFARLPSLGRRRPPALLVLVTAAIALVAAGCNGPSPEEQYAARACSTILLRAHELLELTDDIKRTPAAPGPTAWDQHLLFALRGERVTRRLQAELRSLPVPDTEPAREAQKYLEFFARSALDRMTAEEQRLRRLPENMTLLQSRSSLDRLSFASLNAWAVVTAAPGIIGAEVPELRDAFGEPDSCRELEALGTD